MSRAWLGAVFAAACTLLHLERASDFCSSYPGQRRDHAAMHTRSLFADCGIRLYQYQQGSFLLVWCGCYRFRISPGTKVESSRRVSVSYRFYGCWWMKRKVTLRRSISQSPGREETSKDLDEASRASCKLCHLIRVSDRTHMASSQGPAVQPRP